MHPKTLSTDFAIYQFASYMVGRYRLGYDYLALYWASVLFENIIDRKLKAQDPQLYTNLARDYKQNTLDNKIGHLSKSSLEHDSIWRYRGFVFDTYIESHGGKVILPHQRVRDPEDVRKRLINFKWLRNRVMHDGSIQIEDEKPGNKDEFIYYVWSELAPDSFKDQLEGHDMTSGVRLIDTLYKTTADYMIRAVDETMYVDNPEPFEGIWRADFDDMFKLREKMAALKGQLDGWLLTEAPFLTTDILTTIDTTSGYIWMPLVPRSLQGKEKRKGIYNCSVSILATPLQLRIYMDFGGQAPRSERECYFEFLDSEHYNRYCDENSGLEDLCIFDIDWFSALFNVIPFTQWSSKKKSALSEAWEKIGSIPMENTTPITWNRLLHGFVFSKLDLGKDQIVGFADIEAKLREVTRFYQIFNEYKVFKATGVM